MIEVIMYIKLWRNGKDLLPYKILGSKDIEAFEFWLNQPESYLKYDANLGWDLRANGKKEKLKDEKLQYSYQANSQGIRADKKYSLDSPDGVHRIAVFGDSFTHCDEVNLEESWPFLLEKELGKKSQILNMGVPGYGTDQALLKFEEKGISFNPKIAILGLMTENICRNVNRFRPYYAGSQTGIPLTKPRFLLKGKELVLAEPRTLRPETLIAGLKAGETEFLEENDFYYNPHHYQDHWYYRSKFIRYLCHKGIRHKWKKSHKIPVLYQNEEPLQIMLQITKRFVDTCKKNEIVPVLLVFYGKTDFAEESPYWEPLVKELASQKYIYLDLLPWLKKDAEFKANFEQMFAENGHYSGKGNQRIVSALVEFFKEREEFKIFFGQ